MARYNPCLDASQNVEREHAWPASHCEAYIQRCCEKSTKRKAKVSGKTAQQATMIREKLSSDATANTPLQAAVTAHKAITSAELPGLWLSRVCQTSSHELGHCFGVGHCVYYACAMQSTSSLAEDVRQPPYLCPIDLVKILRALGADEIERYEALLSFCAGHAHIPMFAAFDAWLKARLGRAPTTIMETTQGLG